MPVRRSRTTPPPATAQVFTIAETCAYGIQRYGFTIHPNTLINRIRRGTGPAYLEMPGARSRVRLFVTHEAADAFFTLMLRLRALEADPAQLARIAVPGPGLVDTLAKQRPELAALVLQARNPLPS